MANNQHIIPLEEAVELTHAYQSSIKFQGETKACMLDADAYRDLINQPDCNSVRTYFAIKEGFLTIVVVGVNAEGHDITSGVLLDYAALCPENCDQESELML